MTNQYIFLIIEDLTYCVSQNIWLTIKRRYLLSLNSNISSLKYIEKKKSFLCVSEHFAPSGGQQVKTP